MSDDKEGAGIESHGILARLAYLAKTESLATLIVAFVSFIAASTAFITFYINMKKERTDTVLFIERLTQAKEEIESAKSLQITVSSTRENLDELSQKSAILTASLSLPAIDNNKELAMWPDSIIGDMFIKAANAQGNTRCTNSNPIATWTDAGKYQIAYCVGNILYIVYNFSNTYSCNIFYN